MASSWTLLNLRSLCTVLLALVFLLTILNPEVNHLFSRSKYGALKEEKTADHLRFYFHNILSGCNPTAVRVAEAPTTKDSSSAFGALVIVDDPLTTGPELDSKLVGKAQGIYAAASQTELGFLMVLNFAFLEGKYNGSSLSVVGRNYAFSAVREMSIVGGDGLFRFARGYAQARTHKFDEDKGDAVVEYNVYVFK